MAEAKQVLYIQQNNEFDHLLSLIKTAKDGKTKGVLLIGPPGTGKTLLCTSLAKRLKAPYFVIDGSPDTDRRDLEGLLTITDNSTIFTYGDIPNAIKAANKHKIAFLIINEVNAIRESEQISLNSILSENVINLMSNAGERIELNHDAKLVVIGTMNPGVTGVVKLQQAFDSRFSLNKIISYPEKKKEIEIVASAADCGDEIARIAVEAGRQLRKKAMQDQTIGNIMDTRKIVNFSESVALMPIKYLRNNIEDMIVNKLGEFPEEKKSIATLLSGLMFESKIKRAIANWQAAKKTKKTGTTTKTISKVDSELKTDSFIIKKMKGEVENFIKARGEGDFIQKNGVIKWIPLQNLWDNKRSLTQAYFKLTNKTDLPALYKKATEKDYVYNGKITISYLRWIRKEKPKQLYNFMKKVRPVLPNTINF